MISGMPTVSPSATSLTVAIVSETELAKNKLIFVVTPVAVVAVLVFGSVILVVLALIYGLRKYAPDYNNYLIHDYFYRSRRMQTLIFDKNVHLVSDYLVNN